MLLSLFSCKAMPPAEQSENEPYEHTDEGFDGEDFGGYDYEGWELEEDDPSLVLPPDEPSDPWSWDLIEPSLENGEAFLPDPLPEEAPLVLAEPLSEPVAPDLPELAEESSPQESPAPEAEPPELAEEPERPPTEGEPPPEEPPALPPPPPRIARPSEPVPPPPPAREPLTMPPRAVPDLPARNPPTLTPAPEPPSGVSSRVVRALTGQTVEVPFRGSGWVYLGEASSKRGLNYASRRLDGEGQTFVFRAVEAGTYELKFYRQDFIRDHIINDMVTVVVEEPPLGAAQAQRFGGEAQDRSVAVAGPPVDGQAGVPAAEDGEPPVTEPPLGLPRDTAAEEYLRRAREEYQGGRYPQSLAILGQFLEQFPLGSDEAYWLYAQACEKQGPSRNIRLALDYYRRLVAEYPQSSHYNDARRRIAYLERYYINIQ
jgi:hypothetical protein